MKVHVMLSPYGAHKNILQTLPIKGVYNPPNTKPMMEKSTNSTGTLSEKLPKRDI